MKIKIPLLGFLFLLGLSESRSQYVVPQVVAALPASISESSGLETAVGGGFWTHNDSGDQSRFYLLGSNGALLRTICLRSEIETDCEDMAGDDSLNLYIGDFGNNDNNRTDLRIYKIFRSDSLPMDTVTPGLISFVYPDQHAFPPDSNHLNFDCEAMFHYRDSLYLFSKNRGPSMYSRMYRLPDLPGNYVAELLDSFNTGTWVTSADISPDGHYMALLSEARIRIFSDFSGVRFFDGNYLELNMATYTQKEAVVFAGDSALYMTDEVFFSTGGNLYYVDLKPWTSGITNDAYADPECVIYPNPASGEIFIRRNAEDPVVAAELLDPCGRRLAMAQTAAIAEGTFRISIDGNLSGFVLLRIGYASGKSCVRPVVIE
jgi:hypothetical protein